MQNEGLHHVTRPRRQSKFTGVVFHTLLQAEATHLRKVKPLSPMAKRWKQPKCPSQVNVDEHGVAHPHNGTLVSLKKKAVLTHAIPRMNLEDTVLSERSQS